MIALLYDVHGNLPALTAVLADARMRGADRWLLGGDYATFGAWPRECVDELRSLSDAIWLRGNWERWLVETGEIPDNPGLAEGAEYARGKLGDDLVQEQYRLPATHEQDGTLFCHASPANDVESFLPEPGPDDERLLAGTPARRVVFGHFHLQFQRTTPDGIELVGPGSVGMPFDGDTRAAYALLDDDGAIEMQRVKYNVEEAARAAVHEITARLLRTARFEP